MSIKVKNVSKFYNQQKALHNVSFEIGKGEIVGLLGPNGAGKSTLMKILTGFINPNEGEVKVCDEKMTEDSVSLKQKIGYLTENNPLYEDMYIKEYLHFIAQLYKCSQNNINEMIKLTGLENEQHKKILQLSKGYKQRVGLAAALIHNPEIIILDEPTTGLDPNQLQEIRNVIVKCGQNKTVLLSTHIMQEVEKICDRIIIINRGEVKADSPVNVIMKQHKSIEKYFHELTA